MRGRKRSSDLTNDDLGYPCKRTRLTKKLFIEESHGRLKIYQIGQNGYRSQARLQEEEATEPVKDKLSEAYGPTARMDALQIAVATVWRDTVANFRMTVAHATRDTGSLKRPLRTFPRDQLKSQCLNTTLPRPAEAVTETGKQQVSILVANETCQLNVSSEAEGPDMVTIAPTTPRLLLNLPNVNQSKTSISNAQRVALVHIHVRPFLAPYTGGYCTNTGARKHSWRKGVSPFACYTPGDVMAVSACTGVIKELALELVLIAHCDEPSNSQGNNKEVLLGHSHNMSELQPFDTSPPELPSAFQRSPKCTHSGLLPPKDSPHTIAHQDRELLRPNPVIESSVVAGSEQQRDKTSPDPDNAFKVDLSRPIVRLPPSLRSVFLSPPNDLQPGYSATDSADAQEINDDIQTSTANDSTMKSEGQAQPKKKKRKRKKKGFKGDSAFDEAETANDADAHQLHEDEPEQYDSSEIPDTTNDKDSPSNEKNNGLSDQSLRLDDEEGTSASGIEESSSCNGYNNQVREDARDEQCHTEHEKTRSRHRAGRKRASSKSKPQIETAEAGLDIYDAIEVTGVPQTLRQLETLAARLAQGIDGQSIENLARHDSLPHDFDFRNMLEEYSLPVRSSDQILRHQDALLALLNFGSSLPASRSDTYEDLLAQASSAAMHAYNTPWQSSYNEGSSDTASSRIAHQADAQDLYAQLDQLFKNQQHLLPTRARTAPTISLTPAQLENRIRMLEERNERQSQRITFLEERGVGSISSMKRAEEQESEIVDLRKQIRELEVENRWLHGMHDEDAAQEAKIALKYGRSTGD